MYPFKNTSGRARFVCFFFSFLSLPGPSGGFLVLCVSFIYFSVAGEEMQGLASEARVGLTFAAQMLSLMQLFCTIFF